jgi:pyruvate ferredoxin oxidoreductase alpha subunit/phenylglyoxylate dehydrogenase alpha subunit
MKDKDIRILNGNKAAAYGAKLSRAEIIAVYPITPQTTLVEYLSQFVADGELDASMVEVESEHSVMSVLQGSSIGGCRVFSGTSGQGLAYMYEPYIRTSTMRLPIVMCIVNREVIAPTTVWGGPQDSITVRDAGWIQIYVENNQEILDSVIMAYRIAEDPRVMLPVNICYDGFYLSHMTDFVEIPNQEKVDAFLPPYEPTQLKLDPDDPMSVDPLTPGDLLMEYRYKHLEAMKRSLGVIQEVDQAFGALFSRSYGGLLETYRAEDAEILLLTLGSVRGTARVAVDLAREKGVKVGLVKLRSLRPFPSERLREVLKGRSAVGVLDRNVCFGWSTGTVFMEVRSALLDLEQPPPVINFIDGLGGADITLDHLEKAIDVTKKAAGKKPEEEVHWLGIEI